MGENTKQERTDRRDPKIREKIARKIVFLRASVKDNRQYYILNWGGRWVKKKVLGELSFNDRTVSVSPHIKGFYILIMQIQHHGHPLPSSASILSVIQTPVLLSQLLTLEP